MLKSSNVIYFISPSPLSLPLWEGVVINAGGHPGHPQLPPLRGLGPPELACIRLSNTEH